jgi:hypothetical protein
LATDTGNRQDSIRNKLCSQSDLNGALVNATD